jgi:hypothetical protein
MTALDDIDAEKKRITDRLARVDADRERLMQQLADLDAAERVLSRMAPGAPRRGRRGRKADAAQAAPQARSSRGRRARQEEPDATTPARRRGAGRGGRGDERARTKPSVPIADAVLRAVEALGNAVASDHIREYLARELQMQVRPNHLGRALQSHRRAGRLEEESGRWSIRQAEGEAPTG